LTPSAIHKALDALYASGSTSASSPASESGSAYGSEPTSAAEYTDGSERPRKRQRIHKVLDTIDVVEDYVTACQVEVHLVSAHLLLTQP
jgi:hypothetical protein